MTNLSMPMPLGAALTQVKNDVKSIEDFADTQPSAAASHNLVIAFTGSGSEYFRIWIVNLLLTLVTLGIYYPWAKVRRLRYFHGNTLVGGRPLGYHADPKKMLKGYLLVSVLLILYSVAGRFYAVAGLVAFVAVMLIWPALLKSSMQFRLANTSWRGLRLRFTGDMRGAYRAMIPLFVPALCLVTSLVFVSDRSKPPVWYFYSTAAVMGALTLLFPWLFQRMKAYQHNYYALAAQQTRFEATVGMFYKLFAKVFGVCLLGIVAVFALGAVFGLAVAILARSGSQPLFEGLGDQKSLAIVLSVAVGLVVMLLFVALIKPYATTRMQNLVWCNTHSDGIRIVSQLKARSMLWLSVKNWFFVILTLGLYWPFAAIARIRMQLEAVSISATVDLDALVSEAQHAEGEAAGDAAGDLFGLDIGF
jgi:uncharacterized membrane protein YjgN (DUF898 family)